MTKHAAAPAVSLEDLGEPEQQSPAVDTPMVRAMHMLQVATP